MSTTSSVPPTTSTPAASQPTGSGSSSGGAQNSPLLFFVALGFGVVFTNLWIIVGVKYCFRYNARNRARQNGEDGEPIDLAAMPPHRRRRREKKLMTIDEVNERFPITKYKTWVSTRAAQGLPTEGGVSQSRAASVRDAEGVIEPLVTSSKSIVTTDVASANEVPTSPATSAAPKDVASPIVIRSEDTPAEPVESEAAPTQTDTATHTHSTAPAALPAASTHSGDEDDDAIPAALPGAAEMLEVPGDTCAICIDTLEEDEDVRGLTCGHAFHSICIDPWLTNRRACCPLCKADYYVPKPRPEPQQEAQASDQQTPATFDQITGARRPSLAAATPAGGISRYIPRFGLADSMAGDRRANGRGNASQQAGSAPEPSQPTSFAGRFTSVFHRNRGEQTEPASSTPPPPVADASQERRTRRWAPSLPNLRRNRAVESTTPSQLEAGAAAPQVATAS